MLTLQENSLEISGVRWNLFILRISGVRISGVRVIFLLSYQPSLQKSFHVSTAIHT